MYHPPIITSFETNNHTRFLSGAANRVGPQMGQAYPVVQQRFFNGAQHPSFMGVMNSMMGDMNHTLSQPNELTMRAMTTGDVDIHEIAIANAKADVMVNVTSQVLTKLVQAYERVQQIQV